MKKRPVNPQAFTRRQERIKEMKILFIPVVLVHECKCVLEAYYGGPFRAAWFIMWQALYIGAHDRYWRVVLWISDRIGWTKLRPIFPDKPDFKMRHGAQCDHYNCNDMDCCLRSVSEWFKKLTRLGKE